MKTAMQLMLEDLELKYKVLSNAEMLQACVALEGTIEYAKSLIIKEKEQIMRDYRNGKVEAKMPNEVNTTGTEYYNQTYNQNK